MKVFIDPPNSLVLYDLVERFGHEPLSAMAAIQERVDNLEVDMPPMNVTLDDVVKGLKYAGVEVPSGIRGRLALWGPHRGGRCGHRDGGLPLQLRMRRMREVQPHGEVPAEEARDTRIAHHLP